MNSFPLGLVRLGLGLAQSRTLVCGGFSMEIEFDKELLLCASRDWWVQNVYNAAMNVLSLTQLVA